MPYEEVRMTKGSKFTIAVYYQDNKSDKSNEKVADSASFKLNVTKTEIKPMEAKGTAAQLEAGDYAWYSYTIDKTGEYIFASENGKIKIYESITDNNTISSNILLSAGTTLYIRLENNNSEKQSVKVNVTCVEAMALNMDNPVEVSFTAEDIENRITYKWLSFTPLKTGYYKFNNEAVKETITIYYGQDNSNLKNEYFIHAGKTVYIKALASSEAAAKISVALGDTEFNCQNIEINQTKQVYLEKGERVYFEFTTPASGNYIFYTKNMESSDYHDTYGILCDDEFFVLAYDDDSGEGHNFKITQTLSKGKTVYIEARALNSSKSIGFKFCVELE